MTEINSFIRSMNNIYCQNYYLQNLGYLTPNFRPNSNEEKLLDIYINIHILDNIYLKCAVKEYIKNHKEFYELHKSKFIFPTQDQADYFSPNYHILKERVYEQIINRLKVLLL